MIALALLSLILSAGQCPVENKEFLLWGAPGAGIVQSDPVPDGKVWIVRAAGLFTNDNMPPADYMLELIRPVRSQGDACCWRIPLEKSPRPVNTTPLLALSRTVVLHQGERLAGRTNGAAKFGLNFVYYELPEMCVPLIPL